ncbi:MAG: tetratricopeptide repeat protein [Xanthomonadaceae bacterium]|nr:tetratricopeptide repeat protein [Xanthomonadaceae bacterium]MDE2053220.1 tetratricopeptide repeat protein [Xanthomonadaceae bacterium]MDE2224695.1 tetratricopeptide repeat protein [Xanthomonadaceae bacterium]
MPDSSQAFSFEKLWSELRRRRVIRVIVVYVIVGWVIIEVAATMLPGLNLPGWTVTFVIALVVLGFPVAVVMAWLFDLGPGGATRTLAADPPSPPRAAVDVTAIPAPNNPAAEPSAIATGASMKFRPETPRPTAQPGPGHHSIAVLPFVNMSGAPDNEYFSDGISEEILNLLCKLPQLKVASRTSAFAFKGKVASIPAVAKELNVGTVLEGSVRRAGDRVRITAQLIDAGSDTHLWSETYDREMKDVFAIQDDIAHSIVKALQVTLTPKERRAMQFVATSDPEAYDYYLRGRSYMYSMARRDYEHAIRMYEQAIAVDSKYALAYAGMADAYSMLYRYAEASTENATRANRASEQALALDADSAEAHASRGLALFISENYADAQREFDAAINLNANLFEAYYYYGLACSSAGDYEKAARLYHKAMEVNPADYQAPVFLAQAYASLGEKQDEMKTRLGLLNTVERHLKLNPHDTRALQIGANNLYQVGEKQKALAMAEQALIQGRDEPVVLYNGACFYAMQGETDRALGLLEQAVRLGWGDRAWMEHDSELESLRDDPRFRTLLMRIQ